MERDSRMAENLDGRQYDRIWQRVAPTLEPYPGAVTSGAAPTQTAQSAQTASQPWAQLTQTTGQTGTAAPATRSSTVSQQPAMTTGQADATAPGSRLGIATPSDTVTITPATTPAARSGAAPTTPPGTMPPFAPFTATAPTAPPGMMTPFGQLAATAFAPQTVAAAPAARPAATTATAPAVQPAATTATAPTVQPAATTATAPTVQPTVTIPAAPMAAPAPARNTQTGVMQNSQPIPADNRCCMISMADEDLQALTNFIEDELSDQRYYQAFARQAPGWARRTLMDFAATEGGHAKRLMAVYFLITGICYTPSVSCEKIWIGPWCNALRERYHMETCGGQNYIQAAQSTNDPCLTKVLMELSEEEYGHAAVILEMLQRLV